MPGDPLPQEDASADTEAAAEASRLLAQAEAELSGGNLRSAHKHSRRAARLHPSCPGASLLLAALRVLLADSNSHHATLLLPPSPTPTLSPTSLRRHFKSLSKSLRPNTSSSPSTAVAAAAQEALRRATAAYAALSEQATPATFWTACAACRLLHEFDRKYVGYRLVCPSCRRSFLASEVPPPPEVEPPRPPPAKKPKNEKPEMTLAEMQLQLARKRSKEHKGCKNAPSGEEEEEEKNKENSGMMPVEDSDFYNFDADRGERCFKKGQVWALYGDDDGMPRHYGLVDGVSLSRPFRSQIRWLELQPHGEEGKPCGEFKVGRAVTVHSVNVFSHLVVCERTAREVYRIYPKKGSVWALHSRGEGNAGRKYDIVVFLSGYSETYDVSFGYLEKVEGFKSIFTRLDVGSHAVQLLQKDELGVLSHQIPARKVSRGEGSTLPLRECWELDPAALPPELLRTGWRK